MQLVRQKRLRNISKILVRGVVRMINVKLVILSRYVF